MWGGLILLGVIANAHTASQARALGCIDIAAAPKDYYDPSGGDNRCPGGYELSPSSLTCASITATPTQYATPIGSDPSAEPMCLAGYQPAPKPGPGYKVRYTPPFPSISEQRAACAGHQGAETWPDFPPPVADGDHYIVSCLDGTLTDVH